VQPWFWIGLLLCGPLLNSIFLHWNLYLSTVVLVRLQTILTQLVFEHSLRIRFKAEAPSSSPTSQTSDPIPSSSTISSLDNESDSESVRGETESQDTRQTTTVAASENSSQHDDSLSDTAKGKKKVGGSIKAPTEARPKHSGDAENLMGRINNLVTSDVYNVGEGDEFLNMCMFHTQRNLCLHPHRLLQSLSSRRKSHYQLYFSVKSLAGGDTLDKF